MKLETAFARVQSGIEDNASEADLKLQDQAVTVTVEYCRRTLTMLRALGQEFPALITDEEAVNGGDLVQFFSDGERIELLEEICKE